MLVGMSVGGEAEAALEALDALEMVDDRLRAIYRALADDPDQADRHEDEIRSLRIERMKLAERAGLAALAARRVARVTVAEPPSTAAALAVALPSSSSSSSVSAPAPPSSEAIPPSIPEPPVSVEVLSEWTRAARENGVGGATYEDHVPSTWEATLDELMGVVGAPRVLELELGDELDALDRVSREPMVNQWSALPRHIQQLWLGVLVARTRALRELSGCSTTQRERTKTIISRYPPWAFTHHPGHVHGLKLTHEPLHGTWMDDAKTLWVQLRDALSELKPRSSAFSARKKKEAPPESEPAIAPTKGTQANMPICLTSKPKVSAR